MPKVKTVMREKTALTGRRDKPEKKRKASFIFLATYPATSFESPVTTFILTPSFLANFMAS